MKELLKEKRNAERAAARAEKRKMTADEKALSKRDKEREKIIARLTKAGKSQAEAEFTAALLVA